MSNFEHVVYNSAMDFANHWRSKETAVSPPNITVRTAAIDDVRAISHLFRVAARSHTHADWRPPADWVGSPHFVVATEEATRSAGLGMNLFSRQTRLMACLVAAPDPPPAAWVRLAVVGQNQDEERLLAEMLTFVMASLRETAVTQLGWLVQRGWPDACLPDLGFDRINEIETYVTESLDLPPYSSRDDLLIRAVEPQDFPTLETLEEEAFAPLWRLSGETLELAQREAIWFTVAEWNGRLVGYQLSSGGSEGAHLVRLTISPQAQGQGVGRTLLADAFRAYRRFGLRAASLNTQVDNIVSQRLYAKFGFQPTGERLPVWCKYL